MKLIFDFLNLDPAQKKKLFPLNYAQLQSYKLNIKSLEKNFDIISTDLVEQVLLK